MKNNNFKITVIALLFAFSSTITMADDDNVPPIRDKLVKEECSACHLAFQPAFLTKASWVKMMGNLENHFGEDASLDGAERKAIERYLVANARKKKFKGSNPPLRITELRWFKKEHNDREAKNMMKSRKLKSFVNCAACHKGADRGIYDDD